MVTTAIANVQPVCTLEQFHLAFEDALHGEHELVATAVFKDYTETYQKLQAEPELERVSPLTKLNNRFALANHANQLFDDLLASLSILDTNKVWQRGVIDLRRTVLLRARRSNNPWSSSVWIDLARFIPLQDEHVVYEIDSFLIDNIDNDQK